MMECRRFEELLEAYLDERLEGADRAAWREHLRECARCRRLALEREPVLLLSLAPRTEASGERVAACVGAVRALTHGQRLQRTLGRRRRAWLAAAAAAVLVAAGALGIRGPGHEDLQAAAAPPAVERAGDGVPAPEVEVETRDGEVRVYRYAVDGDMAVAFVVDPSMEL